MPIQNIQSNLLPFLTFTYDDADGNITGISIDTTQAATTADWSSKGNLANNDEAVLVTLMQELYTQFTNKLTDLDSPIASDTEAAFFDSQGITERDSGTTDIDGNAVTETQLFQVLRFVLFYKYDPSIIFTSNSAVNDDD